MKLDHTKFALFNYVQNPTENDIFELGEVVINDRNEIGVIIQRHGNNEYRTDIFGNCCGIEIRLATLEEIKLYRNKLVEMCKTK